MGRQSESTIGTGRRRRKQRMGWPNIHNADDPV
jgi:hypothetical protein